MGAVSQSNVQHQVLSQSNVWHRTNSNANDFIETTTTYHEDEWRNRSRRLKAVQYRTKRQQSKRVGCLGTNWLLYAIWSYSISFKYNLVRKSHTGERQHTSTSTTIQDALLAGTHCYSNNESALTVQTTTYQYKNTTLLYSILTLKTAQEIA